MSELTVDQGVTFDYPVLGSDTLYNLLPKLNKEFGLSLDKENFRDSLASIGLDGYVGLTAVDNNGTLHYLFKNTSYEESKVISEFFVPKFPVVDNASSFLNFIEEISFLEHFEINVPIQYNYDNARYFRSLKKILSFYGYGDYPIIGDGKEPSITGMMVKFYGTGLELAEEYPSLINCPAVVIVSLPHAGGWKDVIIKTEKVI